MEKPESVSLGHINRSPEYNNINVVNKTKSPFKPLLLCSIK